MNFRVGDLVKITVVSEKGSLARVEDVHYDFEGDGIPFLCRSVSEPDAALWFGEESLELAINGLDHVFRWLEGTCSE
jgi:hypothetical protein